MNQASTNDTVYNNVGNTSEVNASTNQTTSSNGVNPIVKANLTLILDNNTGKSSFPSATPGLYFGIAIPLIVLTVLLPLIFSTVITFIARKFSKPALRNVFIWAWIVLSFILNLGYPLQRALCYEKIFIRGEY